MGTRPYEIISSKLKHHDLKCDYPNSAAEFEVVEKESAKYRS